MDQVYLEDGGSVRSSPGVQQVVFARRDEPLARGGELERQHARLVQVQLVLVRFQRVQHLNPAVQVVGSQVQCYLTVRSGQRHRSGRAVTSTVELSSPTASQSPAGQ